VLLCKLTGLQNSTHITHKTHPYKVTRLSQLEVLILRKGFVCFDFEWSNDPTIVLKAASFVDNKGIKKVFLIEDYQMQFGGKAECALLIDIINHLLKYHYSFGWYSTGVEVFDEFKQYIRGRNSDLVILDKRLKANGIPSIISYNRLDVPYINDHVHIDALKIYDKPMVKTTIYKNKYQTSMSLGNVAKAIIGRGKYKDYSGADFDNLGSIEDKRSYVIEDSQLLIDLLQYNDYEVLRLMDSIASLTRLSFDVVCRTGIARLWSTILDDIVTKETERMSAGTAINHSRLKLLKQYLQRQQYYYQDPHLPQLEQRQEEILHERMFEDENNGNGSGNFNEEKVIEVMEGGQTPQQNNNNYVLPSMQFQGGKVIEPIRGEHSNVCVFDVTSLYPTMIVNYNISFDTINCSCCKDDQSAHVSKELIKDRDYWICKKVKGILTERMEHFTAERIEQQKLGNNILSQGLKILINGGYGVFGFMFFKYYNKDVATLIAAYGRHILTEMQKLAAGTDHKFKITYGDTDSLFLIKGDGDKPPLQEDIKHFINQCKANLGVQVKHEKAFTKCLISKKKHYIGIPEGLTQDPVIRGFEGIKSDRVPWVRDIFSEVVQDYKYGRNPISKIKQALSDLNQRNIRNMEHALLKSTRLRLDPEDYENNCIQKRIGLELGLSRGDTVTYYLSDNEKGYTTNVDDISLSKYRKMLLNSIKDILEILGYDLDKVLFGKTTLTAFIPQAKE